MPGTIEVSVLDFMGLQSSSPPFQMSIKVSMGKREYETWDKGDFTFPLTTLRENLIVTLQDARGNEISHTGVETRSVIEKGVWDDTFPLEGGGHVRMKLQFVLGEADRQRIRLMRELALKKKHDELLNSEPRCPKYATAVDSRVASSSRPKHEGGKSWLDNREGTNCVLKQTSPNDPDKHEDASSITPVSQGLVANLKEEHHKCSGKKRGTESLPLKTIPSKEALYFGSSETKVAASDKIPVKLKGLGDSVLGKQNPLDKTPSNVRNMITAFESSLSQDMKPKIVLPIESALSRLEVELPSKSLSSDEVRTEKNVPEQSLPRRTRSPYLTGEMQGASKNITEGEEHIRFVRAPTVATSSLDTGLLEEELREARFQTKGTDVDFMNKLQVMDRTDIGKEKASDILLRALTGEKASISGQKLIECLGKHPYSKSLNRKKHSGGHVLTTKSGKETHSNDLERMSIQGASGDAHYSSECYGAWIFPDERRRLCITTAGAQILNLMGGFWNETKVQTGKMSSSVAEYMEELSVHGGTGIKSKEREKTSERQKMSKLQGSIDAETSRGPVGQVMRVGIMVGFAALVLLTRQKTR